MPVPSDYVSYTPFDNNLASLGTRPITWGHVGSSNTFVSGVTGKALSCPGNSTTQSGVRAVYDLPASEFTVSLRVKKTTTVGGGIISYATSNPATNENALMVFADGGSGVTSMHMRLRNSTQITPMPPIILNLSAVYTFSWKSSTGTLKVYRDGVLYYTANWNQGTPLGTNGFLYLGQEQDAIDGGLDASQAPGMEIEDFYVYERQLTDAEVLSFNEVPTPNVRATYKEELCVNGKLTNGLTGWLNPSGQVNALVTDAERGTVLQSTADTNGNGANQAMIRVQPGRKFRLTGYVKSVTGSVGLKLGLWRPNGVWSDNIYTPSTSVTNAWTKVTVDGVVPGGIGYITIIANQAVSGVALIHDVSLTEIDVRPGPVHALNSRGHDVNAAQTGPALSVVDGSGLLRPGNEALPFSMYAWVRPKVLPAASTSRIIIGRPGNHSGLIQNPSGSNVILGFHLWNTSSNISATKTVSPAEWHHITGIYDGAGGMSCYVDEDTTPATATFTGSFHASTSSSMTAGGTIAGDFAFDGAIARLCVYNVVLTAEERAILHSGGIVKRGLVMHYEFDGPRWRTETVLDKSGYGRHLVTSAPTRIGYVAGPRGKGYRGDRFGMDITFEDWPKGRNLSGEWVNGVYVQNPAGSGQIYVTSDNILVCDAGSTPNSTAQIMTSDVKGVMADLRNATQAIMSIVARTTGIIPGGFSWNKAYWFGRAKGWPNGDNQGTNVDGPAISNDTGGQFQTFELTRTVPSHQRFFTGSGSGIGVNSAQGKMEIKSISIKPVPKTPIAGRTARKR